MCAKLIRSTDDILNRFSDQIQLLELGCRNYDEGFEIAALNIATSIRVLVHDTAQSTSALTHAKKKDISFLDSSRSNEFPNKTFMGLTYNKFIGVHDGKGGSATYKPLLDGFFSIPERWITFDQWWSQVVFQNPDGSSLTRSTLVLKAANQEGGAHIDSEIDYLYDKFRHHYSSGVALVGTKSGAVRSFDNIPVLPALRQVGYEVLSSIRR